MGFLKSCVREASGWWVVFQQSLGVFYENFPVRETGGWRVVFRQNSGGFIKKIPERVLWMAGVIFIVPKRFFAK